MRKILSRFDKHKLAELPRAVYDGRIVVVQGESEAARAVDYLLNQDVIGLDTETRPSFRRGDGMNQVALLQVSSRDLCFLFRLNHMGLPAPLIRLLEDTTVTKVGLSWHDDIRQLHRRAEFTPGTFVELQEFVQQFGICDLSLQKLYANVFNQKISKSQRLSNWEADSLSMAQQTYAATDAWACVKLYDELCAMRDSGDYTLEVVPEPEPPQPKPEGEKPKKSSDGKKGDKDQSSRKSKSGQRRKPHTRRKKRPVDARKTENNEVQNHSNAQNTPQTNL